MTRVVGETGGNLAGIVDGHDPAAVAVISRNQRVTYGELTDAVARGRGALHRLGIGEGDRVAIVCSNGVPFLVGYLALLGLGAVAVPLNPESPAAELQRQLGAVGAKAAVVDRSASSWRQLDRAAVPALQLVVAAAGAELGSAGQTQVRWSELREAEPHPAIDVTADHLAVLMFTSGTAGAPRAAMLTHGNLLANLEQLAKSAERAAPGDVVYGVVPLYHIFGLNVAAGMSLRGGATLLLVQRFDPATAIESIAAQGVTIVPAPPSLWVALSRFAEHHDVPADAFAGVRLAYSGAAKLPLATSEQLEARFGLVVAEGYGLTEASPVVTSSVGLPVRRGSVGAVLDGVELRIVDAAGDGERDALVGDAGELWVRGPNVFAGYADDAEATARVLTHDGWLRTGDLGYCDDDGYVYLVDRAKDLIIVSGFNVSPAEVEEVLARAPGVADVGVVGVPHPHTGEEVRAFVVAEAGAVLDEESLIDFARDHLARYKCPSRVLVVDELPRNASGKLVRRQLA